MNLPAMRSAGDTHRGKVRPTNEDNMIVEPRMGLYAVLDGMGGANAGDVASQLARDTIRDFVMHRQHTLAPAALLEAAIVAGSTAVFTEAQEKTDRHGMGTTVVACLIIDANQVVVSHVGDSRAYLLRDGRLQALTRDHTIVEELAERGLLTPEEAERHPYKNVLSRNLGAKPEAKVDTLTLHLKPGDRLLLCSDGVSGAVHSERRSRSLCRRSRADPAVSGPTARVGDRRPVDDDARAPRRSHSGRTPPRPPLRPAREPASPSRKPPPRDSPDQRRRRPRRRPRSRCTRRSCGKAGHCHP
jgi:serine/threonine protein phosphatase PrpC